MQLVWFAGVATQTFAWLKKNMDSNCQWGPEGGMIGATYTQGPWPLDSKSIQKREQLSDQIPPQPQSVSSEHLHLPPNNGVSGGGGGVAQKTQ